MKRREKIEDHKNLDLCSFCYPSEKRNIIYEDEEVYIMPALGNFVRGYVLMINKKHRDCFAGIINEQKEKAKTELKEIITHKYGSCCLLEHGRVGSCMGDDENRICYHAHMHAVPTKKDFRGKIKKDFEMVEIDRWIDVNKLEDKLYDYLYVEVHSGEKSVFKVKEEIENQYLKKNACNAMGIDRKYSNWKKYPFWETMRKTYKDLNGIIN